MNISRSTGNVSKEKSERESISLHRQEEWKYKNRVEEGVN